MQTNAALSGEQRRPRHLKYCAVNTYSEANRKYRALGIRLKCFVRCVSLYLGCRLQTQYLNFCWTKLFG
ncbi:hypothetical protein EAF56_25175 [Vibrio alginolyticus]|nr:hypothetical protein [Vibrio alginolyticus]